ncbi:hypothetical protein KR054_007892 [Drosophila jambulina]|nr:hypothetical protein KR054_007892 [Drosophila jambulina]
MPKTVSEIGKKPGAFARALTPPDLETHKLWIHCNRCCEQYVRKKCKFFLLACQHVTCDKCVKVCAGRTPSDARTYECPVCHGNVRGRYVSNTMPNFFKQLFHPEPYHLNDEFVITFQMANQCHFDKFKQKKGSKLHKLSKDINLAKSICQKRFSSLDITRVERKKLKQRIRQVKIQKAKQREDTEREKRMAAERQNRIQSQPKSGLGHGQERHQASTVSHNTSIHSRYRNTSISSSSSSQRPKQVTSFRHPPNYSFNL